MDEIIIDIVDVESTDVPVPSDTPVEAPADPIAPVADVPVEPVPVPDVSANPVQDEPKPEEVAGDGAEVASGAEASAPVEAETVAPEVEPEQA